MNPTFSKSISFTRGNVALRRLFMSFLLILSVGQLSAQYSLQGKVINQSGETLPGATIRVENQKKAMATDSRGEFKFDGIKDSLCSLEVSYIGYHNYKSKLNLNQGDNRITVTLEAADIMTEAVIVSATRAGNKTPIAYSNLDVSKMPEKHTGQDLPFLLSLTPSLVATSDAGTGIGYTNFRIRGSDANRINVTVNGIPLNDAESHAVYFVDLPDFASSTENIQVQRGVGSSTNGAGAFGGTVNVQTSNLNPKSYAGWSTAAGSFRTLKNTVRIGSGLIGGKFIFEARLSKIASDGYIDRAASDLRSIYLTGAYLTKNTLLKAIFLSGKEKTYQAWYGVPSDKLQNDRTYNPAGIIIGKNGEVSFYDNETDNYQQDHYQLHYTHQFSNKLSTNISFHYTYGRGYYQEYRQDQSLSSYLMNPVVVGNSVIDTTDLVRRKWLDNDFYGAIGSLSYKSEKTELIAGTAWNTYSGDNFGRVIENILWEKYNGPLAIDHEYYRSKGIKKDYNAFVKMNYQLSPRLSVYADVQYRHIDYRIDGVDENQRNLTQTHLFDFLNPKAGAYYTLNDRNSFFFSYGNAHREPNRSNYTDADPSKPVPTQEKLHDFELGYKGTIKRYNVGINLYRMIYKDQLILTGRINDVGSAIMTNVPESYRTGIEYTGKVSISKRLSWEHHVTLSRNKIKGFVEYVDDWDHWGEQIINNLGTTDIAFSPSLVAGSNILWQTTKNLAINFQTTRISKQYLDNTSSTDRSLNAYTINNLRFSYTLHKKAVKNWAFYAHVNNLFNKQYESNGWVYSYYSEGSRQKMDGYFPQAGRNLLLGMSIEF
ncbi:MAG TPA: TonB-dependent receptor [Prolixibacteraceae bacterium]